MSWTFCTSGQAIVKAGANANSAITISNQTLADWSDEAEHMICNIARVDLIGSYSSLTANGKDILQNIASAMVAQNIVTYDLSSYSSNREAETILDVLENNIRRGINLIENDKIKSYLGAT